MTPNMLRDKPIRKAIEVSARGYTAKVDPIIRDLSNSTQRALRQDLHTFAGFKTYHHLQEVAGRSRNADGTLKSWQEFVADTAKIDDKYNKTWLKAEYAFVQASAQMAAKWERFAEFGDAYDLLYKTAGDERVRADHARLNGMCLPFSDPAWDTCFPPNGWGCRCDVIQVIPGTHPRSESKEVVDLMEEMTPGKQEIFRFNPGKEQKLIPPRHPYYGKKGYDHCTIKQGKLAGNLQPDEECEVLRNLIAQDDSWTARRDQVKKIVDAICGADDKRTGHQPVIVAPMPKEAIEYCIKKGVHPKKINGTIDIYINESQVYHATRPTKRERGAAVSDEDFCRLPEIIREGNMYYDNKHKNIIFAVHDKDNIWIKFCIDLDAKCKKHTNHNILRTAGRTPIGELKKLEKIKREQ